MAKINYLATIKKPQTWLVGGLTLLLVSLFIASSQKISTTEKSALELIYSLPSVLRPLMLVITQFGSLWLAATIVLFAGAIKHRRKTAIYAALAIAASALLSFFLKNMVNRPRPHNLMPGIMEKDIFVNVGTGFPSSHAAVATVLGLMLMGLLPKSWRWTAIAIAFLTGVSRIYLGVHAPLDVLGGFGLGLACAGFIRLVLSRRTLLSTPK